MSNFQNHDTKPKNWLFDPNQSVQRQAERIAKINDDGTSADEILRYSTLALYVLLAYSGLLGAMSYYKNFEPSFGHQAALFMCLALAGTIELGKNFFAKWTLRIPMFRGRGHIFSAPQHTFLWIAALSFTVAAFLMSIRNSTKGGEQLALMLRHQREAAAFTPDTRILDEQISATQSNIEANNKVTYKGTQTYQAQKSNVTLSKSLNSLLSQREAAINQQRADWENNEKIKGDNSSFAASLVMSSGGWVEFLQIVVILLIVACERILLARAKVVRQSSPISNGSQFNNGQYRDATNPANFNNAAPKNNIGFEYGQRKGLTETDRPLTDTKPINTVSTTLEAFKQHRANFYRYRANLRNGDGNRQTVCQHLKTALEGMLQHIGATTPEVRHDTYTELYKFQEVHELIAKEYTVPAEQTPLKIYTEAYHTIYKKLDAEFNGLFIK